MADIIVYCKKMYIGHPSDLIPEMCGVYCKETNKLCKFYRDSILSSRLGKLYVDKIQNCELRLKGEGELEPKFATSS